MRWCRSPTEALRRRRVGSNAGSNAYAGQLAVATGARRNELLALRWSDFDADAKTLRIARAVEESKANGRRVKPPKTHTGRRSIPIEPGTVQLLRAEREKYLCIVAGVPDEAAVDLSLVRLPESALIFPASGTNLCQLRDVNQNLSAAGA